MNRITLGLALVFGTITAASIVSRALGGPVGNIVVMLCATALFSGYSFISRRRRL